MLRLYGLRDHTGKILEYFADKKTAKKERDKLNDGKRNPEFFVCRGPDNRHYYDARKEKE